MSQADVFDANGLSIAASTATETLWGINVTYGENLYDTPLDTSTRLDALKTQMRGQIAGGDTTAAVTELLTATYALNYDRFPWLQGILAFGAIAGGSGIGGVTWKRHRQKVQLQRHLKALQERVASLLMACDELFAGSPKETISYQVFVAAGGDQYPDYEHRVEDLLRQGKQALAQSFSVYHQVTDSAASLSLEEQVETWEKLYVNLVGSRDRIRNLSEDELRLLLDPLQFLAGAPTMNTPLTQQLKALSTKLADCPLTLDLIRVDQRAMDADGILGLIDDLEYLIHRVSTADNIASETLDETRTKRDQLVQRIPSDFAFDAPLIAVAIDHHLNAADAALEAQRPVTVLDACEAAGNTLQAIGHLIDKGSEQQGNQYQVQQLQEQGYRFPEHLMAEVAIATQAVNTALQTYDPAALTPAVTELLQRQETLLKCYQQLPGLRRTNQAKLDHNSRRIEAMQHHIESTLAQTLTTLRSKESYAPYLNQAESAQNTLNQQLPQLLELQNRLEQQNTLEHQQFDQVAQQLDTLETQMSAVGQAIKTIEQALQDARYAENPQVMTTYAEGRRSSSRSSSSSSFSSPRSTSRPSTSSRSSSSGSSRRSSGGSSRRR
ncbi:MAG: hypothetical protein ACFCVB_12155 [Nodosilinea sp.]